MSHGGALQMTKKINIDSICSYFLLILSWNAPVHRCKMTYEMVLYQQVKGKWDSYLLCCCVIDYNAPAEPLFYLFGDFRFSVWWFIFFWLASLGCYKTWLLLLNLNYSISNLSTLLTKTKNVFVFLFLFDMKSPQITIFFIKDIIEII